MEGLLLAGKKDQVLRDFLAGLGYRIYGTDSPADCNIPPDADIDLILLHAETLPGKNLIEWVIEYHKRRAIPIIVTGSSTMHIRLQEKGLPPFTAHRSPYSVGRLSYLIFEELARKRGDDHIRAQGAALSQLNDALRELNDRHRRDLEQAREIQKSLIPSKLPQNERYDLAVFYQPLEEVGGNWYGCREISDGRLSLQFSEVSGRGLSAAFLSSMTRLALTAGEGDAPGPLLDRVNRLLLTSMPQNSQVALFVGEFNPETGELTYASAGNSPALHRKASNKSAEPLRNPNKAIGLEAHEDYTEERLTLEPGDLLLISSRALISSKNRNGEEYGISRCAAALTALDASISAEDTVRHVLDDFDRFREERLLRDDLTLLIMRRTTA